LLFQDLVDALADFAPQLPDHDVSATIWNSMFNPLAEQSGSRDHRT
jgi:hypothetical protein